MLQHWLCPGTSEYMWPILAHHPATTWEHSSTYPEVVLLDVTMKMNIFINFLHIVKKSNNKDITNLRTTDLNIVSGFLVKA